MTEILIYGCMKCHLIFWYYSIPSGVCRECGYDLVMITWPKRADGNQFPEIHDQHRK